MRSLRAFLVLATFFAFTLPLMPLQLLLLKTGSRYARTFPHWYHRQVCKIVGIRLNIEGEVAEEQGVLLISNHVSWLDITVLSAVLTAVGGIAYAQYIAYVNPDTLAGIGVSLRIVFAVVLGGMYSLLGPTVGTALTIALSEYLRVVFGVKLIGMAETIYGLLLVLFIIFLPSGIYGSARDLWRRPRRSPAPASA